MSLEDASGTALGLALDDLAKAVAEGGWNHTVVGGHAVWERTAKPVVCEPCLLGRHADCTRPCVCRER